MVARIVMAMVLSSMLASVSLAQVQNTAQQKCINTVNKAMAKVSKVEFSTIKKCFKAFAKGSITDPDLCLVTGASLQVTTIKGAAKANEVCLPTPTDFGPLDGLDVEAALGGATFFLYALTGEPTVNTVAQCGDAMLGDAPCKCQDAVIASSGKLLGTYLSLFNKCKKAGLKAGTILSQATLDACLSDAMQLDPKGKLPKAEAKLLATVTGKCIDQGVTDPFPSGSCAAPTDATAFRDCTHAEARCTACLYVRFSDYAEIDCDLFDNGAPDLSCSTL